MRLIGTLPTENDARRLCNYLLTQKIDAHAEEQSDGAWQVWIEHDDDVDRGKAELAAFQAAPNDPRYGSAAAVAKKLREAEAREAQRRRTFYRDMRTSWAQSAGRFGAPVAIVLIALSVLVALATQFGANRDASSFIHLLTYDSAAGPVVVGSKAPMFDSLRQGQVWRLVTPIFIHFGPLHLIFNMMWLWRLGQVIEARIGSLRFLAMVLLIAVISCTAEAGWATAHADYSFFGGMSGVVAGLFGYAWMKHKLQPYMQIHVTDYEVGLMLGWLVICSLGLVGSIANGAHWGGLIVGMLLGSGPWLLQRMKRR